MIEYKVSDSERIFYVIFDKRRGNFRFWNLFTSRNFDHIWLITELERTTLVIKPMPNGCELDEWPCNIKQALRFLPKDITAVLKFTVKYNNLSRFNIYSIISCVSYSKYLLGVRGFLTISPFRLFKRLKKLGAKEVTWQLELKDES